MRKIEILSIITIISLTILLNPVSARVGFGMTNDLSEIVMNSDMDKVCITYYIYNPGDVNIEGYLEVDRDSGGTLNRLLGIDKNYQTLAVYENESKSLQLEYDDAVKQGISTYDVEVKQAELGKKVSEISKIITEKTKTSKVVIPSHTESKDANGNYQIPIEFCFDRPQSKFLFFYNVADKEYCGVYEGEVTGKYNPLPDGVNGGTGSAILGSRSAKLKVIVRCDTNEKSGLLLYILIPIVLIIVVAILISKWQKKKKLKEQEQDNSSSMQ